MFHDVKAVIARSSDTLVEDAIGAVSLFVLLFLGLSLPSFF